MHAGETLLPVANEHSRLSDLWGLCVSRPSGRVHVFPRELPPSVSAMICQVFRLPSNDRIRIRRLRLIRYTRLHASSKLLMTAKGKVLKLSRLMDARILVPQEYRDLLAAKGVQA